MKPGFIIKYANDINPWRFCIAPMMQYTDRHFRFLARLLSKRARLYTEMVVAGALTHGAHERFLAHHHAEDPVALQLGGCDPRELAVCAALGARAGFAEINLNVGCPSDRVKSGRFGACLMAEPALVAECVAAMRVEVAIPVTIKTRLGIDDLDAYEDLTRFVAACAGAGCETLLVHARKAWLQGLSPRENREVPPLNYAAVHRLKRDFPRLNIIINGGLTGLDQTLAQLDYVDGAMLGRSVCDDPYLLCEVDARLFGEKQEYRSRRDIVLDYLPYVADELERGSALKHMTKPLLGLFQGQPGARRWRRYLSEHAGKPGANAATIMRALDLVQQVEDRAA